MILEMIYLFIKTLAFLSNMPIAINFRKQNYLLGKRYTVPWSGVGGNPPPLKDDLGWAAAHQPALPGLPGAAAVG